jgi:2-deoxy-D-gluconate 3-dehydrogenase
MSVMQQFDLTGKTALVTGCKRGIGIAMAVVLAEVGANIIGVSATLEESGSDVESAITRFHLNGRWWLDGALRTCPAGL